MAHTFHVEFPAKRIWTVQKKFVIAVKDFVDLIPCQRGGFLEDITAEFLFPLQFDAAVRAVVDAYAVLFSLEVLFYERKQSPVGSPAV